MKTIRTVSAAYLRRPPRQPNADQRCPDCKSPCVGLCLTCASPAKILRIRFVLADHFAGISSATGPALERASTGISSPSATFGKGAAMRRWRDVLHLCRALTGEEEQVCRLRYTLIAGHVGYEREIAAADLGVAMEQEGEERIGRVGDRIKVRGRKAVFASWGQVAEQIKRVELTGDRSSRQCQARFESASAKVAAAQRSLDSEKWHAVMRCIEEAQSWG